VARLSTTTERSEQVAGGGGPALTVRASRDGDSAVLRLAGEIDISNSERLRGRLNDLLARGRGDEVRTLVVDVSGLDFLDLSGLQALLDARSTLHGRGGSLVLRSPTRRVRRLLDLLDDARALLVEP
jgi:anti-anti-sigma factor